MRGHSESSRARFWKIRIVAGAVCVLATTPALAADCGGGVISARFAEAASYCNATATTAVATAPAAVVMTTPDPVSVRMPRSRTARRVMVRPAGYGPAMAAAVPPNQLVSAIGQRYRVDPHLLAAMMHTESRGRIDAVSPKGALGLMQVMPSTARGMGIAYPRTMLANPVLALSAGAVYLKRLQAQLGNNVPLVVAAYNAGPGAVRRYNGVPRYRETRGYVSQVMGRYIASRGGR